MYMTGFADEAAPDIEGQIRATKELGWENIESRAIDGVNSHDLEDDAFERAADALDAAGVRVNCFGSAIANWGKSIEDPPDSSLAEAERAIPRMKRLGTKLIRIMSFAVLKDRDPEDQMEEERFARLRRLTEMFLAEGIQPVHENCMNYGGMGWPYTLRLIENVPGLKLVFDTGNPVFSDDRSKTPPYPKQSAWAFYEKVRGDVVYIHIKDARWSDTAKEGKGGPVFTWPGEGDGDVRRIMADLIARGYDGGISIEPHIGAVYHDDSVQSDEEARYAAYVEYGRRMERMITELGKRVQAPAQ
jgi:sugar phosphate isomerase/epimerase